MSGQEYRSRDTDIYKRHRRPLTFGFTLNEKEKRTSINLEGKKAIHFLLILWTIIEKWHVIVEFFVLSAFICFTFIPCQRLRYLKIKKKALAPYNVHRSPDMRWWICERMVKKRAIYFVYKHGTDVSDIRTCLLTFFEDHWNVWIDNERTKCMSKFDMFVDINTIWALWTYWVLRIDQNYLRGRVELLSVRNRSQSLTKRPKISFFKVNWRDPKTLELRLLLLSK